MFFRMKNLAIAIPGGQKTLKLPTK